MRAAVIARTIEAARENRLSMIAFISVLPADYQGEPERIDKLSPATQASYITINVANLATLDNRAWTPILTADYVSENRPPGTSILASIPYSAHFWAKASGLPPSTGNVEWWIGIATDAPTSLAAYAPSTGFIV